MTSLYQKKSKWEECVGGGGCGFKPRKQKELVEKSKKGRTQLSTVRSGGEHAGRDGQGGVSGGDYA